MLLPEWSTAVFFCLVIVVHESLFWPEQLNCCCFSEKSFRSHKFFGFPAFLCIWTLQQWLYDFEIHLFTLRTTEGIICNYCRRVKRSLMLQKEKPCIKSWWVKTCVHVYIFLFCPNIIFFSFSTALQKLQKIPTCFPEDKISYFYPDLQIQKVFTPPPALNAWFFLLEHQWVFELSVTVAYKSLSVKRWISKS